jgi:hypothetical protein
MALADQIDQARRAGYNDAEIASYLAQQGLVAPAKIKQAEAAGYSAAEVLDFLRKPEPATTGQQLKRAGGLAARDIVMGAAGLPLLVGDAANALINQPIKAWNWATGQDVPRLGPASGAVDDALTRAGLPEPQTRTEKLASGGMRVLTGTGAAGVVGKAVSAAAKSDVAKKIADLFANNLGAQVGSGSAAVLAQDQGENTLGIKDPMSLAALGFGAGILYPQGKGAAEPVGRGVKAAVAPFTEQGRKAIAGSVLRQVSSNADDAVARIENGFPEYVPGSRPLTAEVAGDFGVMGAEGPLFKALDVRNLRGARLSERNAARLKELERIGRDPMAVLKAEAKRDSITAPMREAAFAAADNVDPNAFKGYTQQRFSQKIADLMNGPAGARSDVEGALNWARNRLEKADNPRKLYEVRKDLRAASEGKYNQELPSLRLAKGQLEEVIRDVDEALEMVAPGYQKYMQRYTQMSKPIEQMTAVQNVTNRSGITGVDPTSGADVLSPARLKSRANEMLADRDIRLSKTQAAAIERIVKDMERAAGTTTGLARAPGSDTFKNLSMGALVGRVVGEKTYGASTSVLPRQMVQPLSWLYSLPDQKVADLLVEAMLDPVLYRDLVKTASAVRVVPFSEALKAKALQSGIVSGTTGAQLDLDFGARP